MKSYCCRWSDAQSTALWTASAHLGVFRWPTADKEFVGMEKVSKLFFQHVSFCLHLSLGDWPPSKCLNLKSLSLFPSNRGLALINSLNVLKLCKLGPMHDKFVRSCHFVWFWQWSSQDECLVQHIAKTATVNFIKFLGKIEQTCTALSSTIPCWLTKRAYSSFTSGESFVVDTLHFGAMIKRLVVGTVLVPCWQYEQFSTA